MSIPTLTEQALEKLRFGYGLEAHEAQRVDTYLATREKLLREAWPFVKGFADRGHPDAIALLAKLEAL